MEKNRNICLIDGSFLLTAAFQSLGCSVLNLKASPAAFFDLPAALAEHTFTPDLVLQIESLGRRSIVTGLDAVDCPVIFWSIDPHLNAHWQSAYSNLFDMTCSTQKSWIPRLKEQGAQDVRWLPTFGHDIDLCETTQRTHDVAFVGRMTIQRPARRWMVEFLHEKCAGFDLAVEEGLTFTEMMNLYRNSRIIPNESIFGEVNFRLFEGASCGCLVLSQELGEEQAELFEPGREFDTYANIVELDEKLGKYLKNDRLVHAMGRAAHARIQAEHMPLHRAERILEYAADATRNRATGADRAKWTTLASCAMVEAGLLTIRAEEILTRLTALPLDADIAAAMLRIQAVTNRTEALAENLNTILGGKLFTHSPELNLTGSMAALRIDNFDSAKAFWYRHLTASKGREQIPPATPPELLTLWAKDLKRRDKIARIGFPFDPAKNLPAAATDCLMTILKDAPDHLPTLRLLDNLLRTTAGWEQARVGYLSLLTLHERNDWRLTFEIALADLKSYRLTSGLEELLLAQEMAEAQGEARHFNRALTARDSSGLLAGRLQKS